MLELKEIRKINFQQLISNFGGQTEAAKHMNRKKSQINALCKGRAPIGDYLARAIEQELQIPELYLDTPPKYIEGKTRVIPVYALSGCIKKHQEDILSYIPSNQDYENSIGIVIQNDALEPDYPPETIFIIEETNKVLHGDMVVVAFEINKKITGATFKYIYVSEDNHIGLVQTDLSNKPEFIENYRILGVVRIAILNIGKRRVLL